MKTYIYYGDGDWEDTNLLNCVEYTDIPKDIKAGDIIEVEGMKREIDFFVTTQVQGSSVPDHVIIHLKKQQ